MLAEEAARQKELSVASEITDDKGDNDYNQVKKYQRIVKSLSSRYKSVDIEEIREIAYKLSIRLRVLRVEMPNILKVGIFNQYFKDNSSDGKINVLSIIEIIGRRPFDLKRPKEVALLARYLIEDNSEETAPFSLNNWNYADVVCSIFKYLMGSYEVYIEDKSAAIKEKISTVN